MEFKDYLKEQIKKVDDDNELLLLIYLDNMVQFKYHKGCFADFQSDFCILYDDDVNMALRYDSVRMLQCANKEELKQDLAEDLIKALKRGL